jgi:hypothetical protein
MAAAAANNQYACSPTNSDCISYYKHSRVYKKLATITVNALQLDVYYVEYTTSSTFVPLYVHYRIFMVDPDGIIQCHFTIKGNHGFGTGHTMDMTIHINESTNHESRNNTRNYTKKGLSPVLIYCMVREIEMEKKATSTQKLFIDVDASAGFWDSIGMHENPTYNSNIPFIEGKGYEKVITFAELKEYCKKKKSGIERIIGGEIFTRNTRKSPSRRRGKSSKKRSSSTRKSNRSRSRSPRKP